MSDHIHGRALPESETRRIQEFLIEMGMGVSTPKFLQEFYSAQFQDKEPEVQIHTTTPTHRAQKSLLERYQGRRFYYDYEDLGEIPEFATIESARTWDNSTPDKIIQDILDAKKKVEEDYQKSIVGEFQNHDGVRPNYFIRDEWAYYLAMSDPIRIKDPGQRWQPRRKQSRRKRKGR